MPARGPDWTKNRKLKVAITFDDGWCDNASEVFPLVRKHKAPITIFIVARRIGSVLPFWPEQTAAVLGPGLDIRRRNYRAAQEPSFIRNVNVSSAASRRMIKTPPALKKWTVP